MKLNKFIKNLFTIIMLFPLLCGCTSQSLVNDRVVFYSNADDEAVLAMENALKANGYKDKYIFQSFGTAELGGKLLAEGSNIEADLITMSSYYVDSSQSQKNMFLDLNFDVNSVTDYPKYEAPITSQECSIFVNTKVMKETNLPLPKSIKDLGNPIYKDMISVPDINSSSTAWLLILAIIDSYGTGNEAKQILTDIYINAGNHIENSGSGPIKKVRVGEVAIGFGLRQQAISDKQAGLPIEYIDPIEGNFSIIEVISVVNKGGKQNLLAMEMAQCIVENARPELLKHYPSTLYKGETSDKDLQCKYEKTFKEQLTIQLLQKHIAFSEECKKTAQK